MSKPFLLLLFCLSVLTAASQRVYFVYLQTDNDQPFFVRMGDKTYSSSASGYVILSRLRDTVYRFSVGFPQDKWPEQYFTVSVDKKDHGYQLKNFGEKGWGLFDWQTLGIQMAEARGATGAVNVPEPGNGFTDILAVVAGDSSLKAKSQVPVVEVKKEAAVQAVSKEEVQAPASNPPPVKSVTVIDNRKQDPPVVKQDTMTKTSPALVSGVKKDEPKTVAAKKSVVTDNQKQEPPVGKAEPVVNTSAPIAGDVKKEEPKVVPDGKATAVTSQKTDPVEVKDTLAALANEQPANETKGHGKLTPEASDIPGRKADANVPVKNGEEVSPVNTDTKPAATNYKPSKVTKRSESSTTEGFGLVFIDDDLHGNRDTIRLVIPNPKPVVERKESPKEEKKFLDITAQATAPVTKTDSVQQKPVAAVSGACAGVAAEADFFKLRKNMAAAEGDDEMIGEARKYFKEKCFSSAQIKNLSALFLTDEGKYKFFDAAYGYTTDAANFEALQSELKDDYYIKRFRAMLRQ